MQALKQAEENSEQIKSLSGVIIALMNAKASADVINASLQNLEQGKVKLALAIFTDILEKAKKGKKYKEGVATAKHISTLKRVVALPFSVYQTSNEKLLEWQKPRADQMMTWYELDEYVKKMNKDSLMGHSDWKLPAIGELREFAEFIKNAPDLYSDIDLLYWSSEDLGSYSVEAAAVNLRNARMEWFDINKQVVTRSKNRKFAVRLVRNIVR